MKANRKINILIAEDDAWAAKGIENQLMRNTAGYNIHLAKNGKDALHLLEKVAIDVLITDIVMEPVNGIELARKVRVLHPDTRIIVLSANIRLEHIKHLVELDVSIINRINGNENYLENALLMELSGDRFVSPDITHYLKKIKELSKAQDIEISTAEKHIINLLSSGTLVKNIHLELNIGKRTVERMLANLRCRFGANSNTELINKAKDIGLI